VSERHLHRELVAAVGAGPLALARTRRAQTARLLIDQTRLSLAEIAFAAGFASIRQFNETMLASFGAPPGALRRRERPALEASGGVSLRLGFRPPLAAGALLDFLARRAIPGVEEVAGAFYRRTIAFGRAAGLIELRPAADHVAARLQLDDVRDLGLVVQRCRALFDLDLDPHPVAAVLGADPALAPLVATWPGLRLPGTIDGWEVATRAVLGQQVSVAAARTLAGRLAARYGTPLAAPDGGLTHRFPAPDQLAGAALEGVGLTRARAGTLRALAAAVAAGRLVLDRGADRDEAAARLQALPGIGPWTAAYVAMRALGDPDASLVADLGVRRAAARLGLPATPGQLRAHAERWRPWRAYAAVYLWRSLEPSTPTSARPCPTLEQPAQEDNA
jgi:AraC family transcriptional regulator of adaptative response / DNA-3-methyladenine glycosylase II